MQERKPMIHLLGRPSACNSIWKLARSRWQCSMRSSDRPIYQATSECDTDVRSDSGEEEMGMADNGGRVEAVVPHN
jgi:hypothetical protein